MKSRSYTTTDNIQHIGWAKIKLLNNLQAEVTGKRFSCLVVLSRINPLYIFLNKQLRSSVTINSIKKMQRMSPALVSRNVLIILRLYPEIEWIGQIKSAPKRIFTGLFTNRLTHFLAFSNSLSIKQAKKGLWRIRRFQKFRILCYINKLIFCCQNCVDTIFFKNSINKVYYELIYAVLILTLKIQ